MIENDFLIKLFEFRAHAKNRAAAREDLDHAIDLGRRVVKIKTGARRAGQTELAHQRLIAMMSAAQRQPVLIGERRQIVRVRRLHDETNERAALTGGSENADAGQFGETLGWRSWPVARRARK